MGNSHNVVYIDGLVQERRNSSALALTHRYVYVDEMLLVCFFVYYVTCMLGDDNVTLSLNLNTQSYPYQMIPHVVRISMQFCVVRFVDKWSHLSILASNKLFEYGLLFQTTEMRTPPSICQVGYVPMFSAEFNFKHVFE